MIPALRRAREEGTRLATGAGAASAPPVDLTFQGEAKGAVAIVEAWIVLNGLRALVSSLEEQILDAEVKNRGSRAWFAEMGSKAKAARETSAAKARELQDQVVAWEKAYRPERWR
ncbi:hypothetical protein VQH23_07555 [Pararoseomonas sp. SCSIO 73927]|uniref:hypothetical protein n=1 Tax=Pararoseomonas sp. SCSIO 73927 TaxID=3114537 RepID=UPI0030CEF4E7